MMGSSLIGPIIIIVILLLLIVFCIHMVIVTTKAKKIGKKALQEKQRQMGFIESMRGIKHTIGLPLAENVFCDAYYCPDKMVIESSGSVFNLPLEKITSIDTTTDVELHKQYVSSVGGAIGGAMLFGTLGAMIGGRAKEKTSKTVTTYLVITYNKEDSLDYISFDISAYPMQAYKFVNLFKSQAQTQKKEFNL